MTPTLLAGTVIVVAAALLAIWRRVDVRLVLVLAGLLLLMLAGTPAKMFDTFMAYIGREDIIGPICSAMGYAFVLKATGADRDMVRVLVNPIRKVRWLLIPGGCAIGFITNMAITSQTATAAAVGPILLPLMLAAGFHPAVAGATLITGCSVGGNLYNPGDPDIVAVHAATNTQVPYILSETFLPNLIAFAVATLVLVLISRRLPAGDVHTDVVTDDRKPNLLRALLPPLPVMILLLLQPSLNLWPALFRMYPQGVAISTVMLCCTAVVMAVTRQNVTTLTREFFSGMGYAFTHVISLIIAAACFIEGLKGTGAIAAAANALVGSPTLAGIFSPVLPWCMAVVCGSGTAPSVSFSQAILPTVAQVDVAHAVRLGVMGAIGASLGRTMSPVSAIVLFTSTLTEVDTRKLVGIVMWPMMGALLATIVYAVFWA